MVSHFLHGQRVGIGVVLFVTKGTEPSSECVIETAHGDLFVSLLSLAKW